MLGYLSYFFLDYCRGMFSSFIAYFLVFLLLRFQLTEPFGKNVYRKFKLKLHTTSGELQATSPVANKALDLTSCHSNGSLCDSVLHLGAIEKFLYKIVREFPSVAKLSVIGRSYEHRPIYSLEIFRGSNHDGVTTVVVECGTHGREWASPAAAVYTIVELLEHGWNLTKTIRWLILPVLNPDGYHHSVTEDNMWKKNRSPHDKSKQCSGVDVDRNFDVGWNVNADLDPCKEDYPGSRPFSEFESSAVRSLISSLGPFEVDIYVSVHSCWQAILYPYSHSLKALPQWKRERLSEFGQIMAKAMMKMRNRNYEVDVAHKFGGSRSSAADYMYDHFYIPYVYTLELGDRAYFEEYDFHHCYHPPSVTQMDILAKECYAGLISLAAHVSSLKVDANVREVARSLTAFPAVVNPLLKLITLITLLL